MLPPSAAMNTLALWANGIMKRERKANRVSLAQPLLNKFVIHEQKWKYDEVYRNTDPKAAVFQYLYYFHVQIKLVLHQPLRY